MPAGGSAFGANLDVRAGPVYQRWFGGGTTNVAYNCLDRQVARGLGDKAALLWEGNDPGHHSALTYSQLLASVCQLANYLRLECGVGPGDIVVAYLPMRLELPVLMLACARLGAVHSVVFGGFSADALAQRVVDCRPRCVVTCTAVRRGAKPIPLKAVVDAALALAAEKGVTVPVVLVAANESAGPGAGAGSALSSPGRDVWWHDAVPRQATACPVAWVDAEHPLFMLYTSGSTGKPKARFRAVAFALEFGVGVFGNQSN